MPDLTPEQLKQALQNAVAEVEANMGNILFNAANIGASQMQFRVFNKGIATAGTNMRYRSAPYKRLRTDAGLQVNHKDLMFTGNLFNSLTILSKSNEQVSYGFNNAETATIRTYQETSPKQVNEPIFDLNEKEQMAMYKAIGKDLGDLIIKTITAYPNRPAKVGADPVEKSKKRNAKKVRKQKQAQKKQDIETRFESKKVQVDKSREVIAKREKSIQNARLRVEKAKTPQAKQKALEQLKKSREALAKSKEVAQKKRTSLRVTRAKFKRITGKRK
jgi:hypothetical protein